MAGESADVEMYFKHNPVQGAPDIETQPGILLGPQFPAH